MCKYALRGLCLAISCVSTHCVGCAWRLHVQVRIAWVVLGDFMCKYALRGLCLVFLFVVFKKPQNKPICMFKNIDYMKPSDVGWCDGSSDRSLMVDHLDLFLVLASALRLV